jgi:hypothetical protein
MELNTIAGVAAAKNSVGIPMAIEIRIGVARKALKQVQYFSICLFLKLFYGNMF